MGVIFTRKGILYDILDAETSLMIRDVPDRNIVNAYGGSDD